MKLYIPFLHRKNKTQEALKEIINRLDDIEGLITGRIGSTGRHSNIRIEKGEVIKGIRFGNPDNEKKPKKKGV